VLKINSSTISASFIGLASAETDITKKKRSRTIAGGYNIFRISWELIINLIELDN